MTFHVLEKPEAMDVFEEIGVQFTSGAPAVTQVSVFLFLQVRGVHRKLIWSLRTCAGHAKNSVKEPFCTMLSLEWKGGIKMMWPALIHKLPFGCPWHKLIPIVVGDIFEVYKVNIFKGKKSILSDASLSFRSQGSIFLLMALLFSCASWGPLFYPPSLFPRVPFSLFFYLSWVNFKSTKSGLV